MARHRSTLTRRGERLQVFAGGLVLAACIVAIAWLPALVQVAQ